MMPFRAASFSAGRASQVTLYIAISLVLAVMLSACGKKGPVRPKVSRQLEAPVDVTLKQQGNLFVLGWTIPSTGHGADTEELTGFRIKRLVYDAAEGCPTCREPQVEVAKLDIKHPAPGQRIGKRIYWRDLDIRPANGYRYAIVPMTPGGTESPSAKIHLAVQEPPPAPSGLQVEAGDTQVAVQWTAPSLPDDMRLVGYNLYRRQAKRPFPIVPVNIEPLKEPRLLDRGLDNDRAYEYRVSALVQSGDQLLESMATSGALVAPQKGR